MHDGMRCGATVCMAHPSYTQRQKGQASVRNAWSGAVRCTQEHPLGHGPHELPEKTTTRMKNRPMQTNKQTKKARRENAASVYACDVHKLRL